MNRSIPLDSESIKPYLVDLLFEQFKQEKYFDQLEKYGIEISGDILVDVTEIIFDIIGFPRDNTLDYDIDYLNSGGDIRDETKKIPDDKMFCRDWLSFKYSEMTENLTDQNIIATKKGLHVEEEINEKKVKAKLTELVNWYYEEFAKLDMKS